MVIKLGSKINRGHPLNNPMTRDEWLAAKLKSISSTESPALFSVSPYLTPYELAVQKLNAMGIEEFDNERTRWGQRLQDSIAQGIADDFGIYIEGIEYEFMPHPSVARMGASFDYRIVGYKEGTQSPLQDLYVKYGVGLLEIKNVDSLVYRGWPEDEAPDHIEIQVQHQLEVSRHGWAVLGVLVGGNRTEIYTRMRDEIVGAAIASKVSKFWQDLDAGVLPPPVMPQDADIIIKLHQFAEPNTLLDAQWDEDLTELCAIYQTHSATEAIAAKAKDSAKARILQRIGSAERALARGYNIAASMVAEAEVPAYTRKPYRYFKVTKKEAK